MTARNFRPGEFNDSFDLPVFEDHLLISRRGVSVLLENAVVGSDAEHLWEAEQRGFAPLNESTLSRQSLGRADFLDELRDPTIIKYVARNEAGTPVGYMAVEKGLFRGDASPFWDQQDDDALSAIQREFDPGAPAFYIDSFLVDKAADEYMLRIGEIILKAAVLHFQDVAGRLSAKPLCFFDFAPPNGWLPDYIMRSSRPSAEFQGAEVVIWPVYCTEWYRIESTDLTEATIRAFAESIPPGSFSDHDGSLTVDDGIALEIQPERLEGDPGDYCTITNLPSITEDVTAGVQLLATPRSPTRSHRYSLLKLKRLGDVRDPISLGERLTHQTYVAQALKEWPIHD